MYSTGVESKPIRSEHRGERMQTVHVLMPECATSMTYTREPGP
jgi:hypothetical protein